uniref:Fatty acid synthase n=1 Tax=Branchiostoma floridae TaxID=7739 RepID=C3ZQX0_BRAFL|eukprot:XP_002589000.1 hypothetical protein BRAFLDRAFT_87472 [Branchiostoma floridae]
MEEKVAIVGIGCRYPGGVHTPADFWTMLAEGRDCTIPPPDDRFDTSFLWHPDRTPGKLYNRCGGYLQCNVFEFDRQFFKIPPDEANHLDPQIQILLEVTWEALENAGIPPRSIRGSNTGVYVGVTSSEYLTMTCSPYSNISQYTNSGTNSCMVSNRISYEFDLHGPSFSVDTACSSSLYSIHLASEAIRKGDCSMAIAGGVNLMLLPITSVGFCQAGMLSPDGKCKSFDASADGYCRSEGAGVVVLKPLSRALADGDRVYAVIRGGTLTNDGRTPGIANPSYDAQLDLVEKACAAAKVHPHDIQYVEAHGTGTKVGDRTEANALGQILGRGRTKEDPPLYIGSVKSNFGHAEGAAGVAGVIKLALMISKAQIPRVVHFSSPNPDIHFDALNIKVPSTLLQWEGKGTRLAGCSSFGFGGANAHLILERPPTPDLHPALENSGKVNANHFTGGTERETKTIMLLSGNTKAAMKEQVEHWISFLSDTTAFNKDRFLQSLYTAANRYQHHAERLAIVVNGLHDAVQKLNLMAREEKLKTAVEGKRFEDVLKTLGADWSIADMLTKETNPDKINRTDIAQPCICAVQMGLVELLRQYDVIPDAIVGHSVGEVAAAYAAGLLSFEDAVRVIYYRGKELCKTSGHGKMLAVLHPMKEVEELVEKDENRNIINVAATNSPNQIVLSGDDNAIDSFHNKLKSRGIKCVLLKVNNAFHSYQQEQVKDSILKKLSILSASSRTTEAQIPMISTVTNQWLSSDITNTAHYWWTNIRQQVRFMQSAEVLLREGYSTFVEIGAHSALGPALKDISSTSNSRTTKQNIIPTLVRPRDISSPADDRENILITTGTLHVVGYPVNFSPAFEEKHRRVRDIPAYPWQRVLCNAGTETSSSRYLFPQRAHPLLGQAQETTEGTNSQKSKVWCSNLSEESVPWLKHHILDGNVVVPAAAYMETALAATSDIYGDQNVLSLKNLQFKRFMFAPTSEALIKTTLQHKSTKEKHFGLYSKDASGSWVLHATAEVHKGDLTQPVGSANGLSNVAERCFKTISSEEIYEAAEEAGFHLGSSFHCVTSCTASDSYEEAVVTAEAPEEISREFGRYIYHPAFMDTFLHTFACLSLLNDKYTGKTPAKRVPFSMKSLCMFNKMPLNVTLYFRISKKGPRRVVDITVTDPSGLDVICEVEELMFEDIDAGSSSGIKLWNLQWEPIVKNVSDDDHEPTTYKHVLVLHENESFGTTVSTALQANLGSFQCLSIFKHLTQRDLPPSLWIFTRGSSSVMEQDTVSPFLAGTSSLCLSISQEHPQFKVKAVDLTPQLNFVDAAAEVLSVLKANPRENEIAARMVNSPDDQHVNLYARRLTPMKPDQILTSCSPNESWAFDSKQRQNGKKLYKAHSSPSTRTRNEATVKVAAFAVCPFTDVMGGSDGPAHDMHLICGTVHHPPTDMMVQDGSRVMGVVVGCISPHMNIQMRNLVPLPDALSWSDAVALVKDFMPAFSFFQKIQTVCKEDRAVVFLPDEDNKEAVSYATLALHQQAEVCVVGDTVQNTSMELSSLSHILHQQQKGLKMPDIVTVDDREVQLGLDIKQNQFKAVDNATYVVTGGLKGFGLALLEWMAKCGARHLVVLARSEPNEEARIKLEALSSRSVDVRVMKVDVTEKNAVEEALTWAHDTMPPIEGIFHCAAVYADKLMDQTAQEDWERVMLPKAVGAMILHDVTKKLHIRLRHFVLISSVVALFGNTGQVGYCAANSSLIALGEARRQEGLPATVASFGVINSTGFAERSGLIQMWERMGLQSISPHDALEILGCMIENQYPHFGITATFDIRKYCSAHKSMAIKHLQAADTCFSRFTTMIPNDVLSGSVSLSDKVLATTKDKGLGTIQEELIAYLGQQLGIEDTTSITAETSPVSLGLDSLLSVNMSNEIADKFEVTVTSVELLSDKMTAKVLSESIYDKMANLAGSQGTDTGSVNPAVPAEGNSWLHFFGNLQDPILTLVCFPANGGGPSLFHQWGEHFSEHNIEELRVSPTLFDPFAGTQQVMEEAKAFSFLPEAVINNPAHLRRLLPCLQAGIEICKSYICGHPEPLPCRVVAFGGQDDPFVSPDLLDNWELVASDSLASRPAFRKYIMQGGHFFITASRQDVISKLTRVPQEDNVVIQSSDKSRRETPNVVDMEMKPSSAMAPNILSPIKSTPAIHPAAAYLRYQIRHPTFYTKNLYVMFRTQNIPADVDSWRSVFAQLMDRHETLRSTYHVSSDAQHPSGAEARYYKDEGAVDIEVLSGYQQKEAEEAVYQRTKVPFQLDKEYPTRCIVAPTGKRSAVIGLVLHHISTDTASINILFRDFGEAMRAHSRKKTFHKPQATLTYYDFTQYYYFYLQRNQKELRNFWRSALPSTVPSINLPFAKPRPLSARTEGGSLQVELSKEQVHRLQEYAKAIGTTVYSIIATTYQLLLHIYTNHDDIVIAIPFDMRMLAPQFSHIHGLCEQPLPLSVSFKNKEQSYRQTVLQSFQKLQECKKHGIYPMEEIMKLVSYEKHPTMDPIMQYRVIQNDLTGLNSMFTDKRIAILKYDYHDYSDDLVLRLFQDTNTKSLSCSFRYAKSLFDEEVAQCMLHNCILNIDHIWDEARDNSTDRTCSFQVCKYAFVMTTTTTPTRLVRGTHAGLLNRLKSTWQEFPHQANDVCCLKSPLTGRVDAMLEIFGPLLQGVPVVIIPTALLFKPALLLECISGCKITRLSGVHQRFWNTLLQELSSTSRRKRWKQLALKYIFTDAGSTKSSTLSELSRAFPHATIVSTYSTLEVYSGGLVASGSESDPFNESTIAMKPMNNTKITVLVSSENGQGTLCISVPELSDNVVDDFPALTIIKDGIPYYITERQASLTASGMVLLAKECKNGGSKEASTGSSSPDSHRRLIKPSSPDEPHALNYWLLQMLQKGTVVRKMTSKGWSHKKLLQLVVENDSTANLLWGSNNKSRQLPVSSISSIQSSTVEGKPSLHLISEERDFTFLFNSNQDQESWRHALWTLVNTAADGSDEDTRL